MNVERNNIVLANENQQDNEVKIFSDIDMYWFNYV